MALQPQAQLGPYEILNAIGAGGMGEVYRARDMRLNRTVAIKVLPEHISRDPDSKQRFDREAQTIANLKHPNICVLYDVGRHGELDFLVMEYLEGISLAAKLEKGPIPFQEALKIALEVADALDKAHSMGVIHRDIKPGNIMLTAEGTKLLDFGLAKVQPAVASANSSLMTAAPTVTAKGTIIGTLQYMAPEQIEGEEADARTDIFAFGAVLYEMVTGRKAFQGKSQPSLMSAILSTEPPMPSGVLSGIPRILDHVIKGCLAKDPEQRWQSARDLSLQLKWAGDPTNPLAGPAAAERVVDYRPWAVSAVLAVALLAALVPAVRYLRSSQPAPLDIRFDIATEDIANPLQISVSPDGRRVVYLGRAANGSSALWMRPINSLHAQILPGTEGAQQPFWSPDSEFIGFASPVDGKLKKIAASGGPPQTVTDITAVRGRGAWNRNGVILFTDADSLQRVSANGGDSTPVTAFDKSLEETSHNWAWFLPDGHHFLYLAWSRKPENRALYVGDIDSKDRVRLMASDSMAAYVDPGFIFFLREGTLMARAFDADRLQFTGEAVPLAEHVIFNSANGRAGFDVSTEGTLIYRTGERVSANRQMVWFDRQSKGNTPVGATIGGSDIRLSPDGKRVAFTEGPSANETDVYIYDIQREVKTRLTTDPSRETPPVWSPDGSTIVFQSFRGGTSDESALYEKPSNGVSPEKMLLGDAGLNLSPRDWSLDGRYFVYVKGIPRDLWVLPMTGERKPFPYLTTPFGESQASISPDSRWLAYASNESGTYEVWAQPFPDPSAGKWQISTEGGAFPRWRRDGRELFYVDAKKNLVAVPVTTQPKFEVGKSTILFELPLKVLPVTPQGAAFPYDVTADGQQFLVAIPLSNETIDPITVILNWTSLLGTKPTQNTGPGQ